MRKTRVAAAVLCATMFATVPVVASGASAATLDRPAAAVEHGVSTTLIGTMSREEAATYLAGYELDPNVARRGVSMYRISYRTTGADGRPTTASALVVAPTGHGATLPTVEWLHGTRAFRGDVASLADNFDRASAVLFAAAGHPTVAPDYIGLGTGPGTHPYIITRPTVAASLDALRAARHITKLDRRVLVTGFSQGGQASMLVARALQQSDGYFRLGAVASVNGPLDIRGAELPAAFDGRLDPYVATFYLGYVMVVWNRQYHLWDSPTEAFQQPYAAKMDTLFNNDTQEADIIAALPASPDELFTPKFADWLRHPTGKLARVIERNDGACDWRPRVPVQLWTARGDRDVAMANSLSCGDMLAQRGVDAKVIDVGDYDHYTAGALAVPQVLDWFARVS